MKKLLLAATISLLMLCFIAPAQGQVRVALVSGSEAPAYQANFAMTILQKYLEENYPIQTELITSQEGSDSFDNLEALKTVDTAVFFVRRKTPSNEDLSIIKDFINSGKGFVALRPTSHAWENWTTFDQEVLGATYNHTFHVEGQRSPPMDSIITYEHPIFHNIKDFTTDSYMYDYLNMQNDVQVIMEGEVDGIRTPMAWTRVYQGGRIFRFVPGDIELFQDENYLKIVGNGIMWVVGRDIPE